MNTVTNIKNVKVKLNVVAAMKKKRKKNILKENNHSGSCFCSSAAFKTLGEL